MVRDEAGRGQERHSDEGGAVTVYARSDQPERMTSEVALSQS
jgi:hypothetical protein